MVGAALLVENSVSTAVGRRADHERRWRYCAVATGHELEHREVGRLAKRLAVG